MISCSTTKQRATENPNFPFLYTNGYKDYKLKSVLRVDQNETAEITELPFNAVESAMYTQKLMFDKFGAWNKEIKQPNYKNPTLIWENIKIFANKDKYYTVAANGVESNEAIYASVMVYNSENNDCLSADNPEKELLIKYFSNEIKKLNNNENFYQLYHKKFDGK